jgi:translation initiation factor 1 (eIF-1/SUI1)
MVQGNHVEVVRDVLEEKGINKKWILVEVAGKKK